MPDTTKRPRAVLLTALLVTSLVAVGTVFSGGAVAAASEDLSVDRTTIGAESTTTTINASASLDATADASVVNITDSEFLFDDVSASDVTVGNSSTESGAASVDAGESSLDITLSSELNVTNGETVYVEISSVENPPVDTAGLPGDLSRGLTVRFADGSSSTIDETFDASFEFTLEQGRFDWDREAGSGNVTDGTTLYRGEGDITIYSPDGNEVSPSSLERTGGASEGVPLALPVPADQPVGSYSDGSGTEITVQRARVTTFEVNNNNGADVNGGTLMPSQDQSEVEVAYNFGEAERLELTIEDADGVDVTNEFLAGGEDRYVAADGGEGAIGIDPGNVDRGKYTFTVEGEDDLDFGEATQSTTITVSTTSDDSPDSGEDGADDNGDGTDDGETGDDGDDTTDDSETGSDEDGDETETDGDETDSGGDDGADDEEDSAGDGSDTDDGGTDDSEDGSGDGDGPDDQPGFGVIVTLLALLGAALIAIRRRND